MTPAQEAKAHAAANAILDELAAAETPEQCAAIAEKHAKIFARLQQVLPVRAIHIVNLAALRKREFALAGKIKRK